MEGGKALMLLSMEGVMLLAQWVRVPLIKLLIPQINYSSSIFVLSFLLHYCLFTHHYDFYTTKKYVIITNHHSFILNKKINREFLTNNNNQKKKLVYYIILNHH